MVSLDHPVNVMPHPILRSTIILLIEEEKGTISAIFLVMGDNDIISSDTFIITGVLGFIVVMLLHLIRPHEGSRSKSVLSGRR